MLYSNLLKRGMTIVSDENKCLVDSNELIARKLENYHKVREEQDKSGFKAGLQAREIEVVETMDEEDGISAIVEEEPVVYAGPDPEELLAEARERIFQMEDEAKAALEEERLRVIEEARNEGYSQGFQKGEQEGKAQFDSLKSELEVQKRQIEAEYQQLVEELEPRFIDTLTSIYEHLFHVELGQHKEILVHLIGSAMSRAGSSKTYLVHVAKEDFPYVSSQKSVIQDSVMALNATVEIIEDISLRENECLIETDGGIFDCGLGTQLSELTRKIKLLSFEKE